MPPFSRQRKIYVVILSNYNSYLKPETLHIVFPLVLPFEAIAYIQKKKINNCNFRMYKILSKNKIKVDITHP